MRRHEITDRQWEAIAPLLPGKTLDCGVTAKNNHLFFNAVVWIMRAGCPWADLPERFDLPNTVWKRFRRLALKGVWERAFQALQAPELDWVMRSTRRWCGRINIRQRNYLCEHPGRLPGAVGLDGQTAGSSGSVVVRGGSDGRVRRRTRLFFS